MGIDEIGRLKILMTKASSVNRDMPYLTEFWESESLLATVWNLITDGLGAGVFETAGGYMYFALTTGAVADEDSYISSGYRWQVRPSSFGGSNSRIQRLVLEWKAQVVTAITSHDNTHFFMGFSSANSNAIAQQNIIGFYLDSDVLKGKTDNAGAESSTGAIAATLTDWNEFKIMVDSGRVIFSLNGVDETVITTNLPNEAMYIVFGTRAEAGVAVGLNIGNVRCWYEEKEGI